MVEWFEQRAALGKLAQAVEAHGVNPLENVPVLSMLGSTAVFLEESLDVLEARDDAFLARRPTARLFRRRELLEFRAQFVEVDLTHSDSLS